MTIGKRPKSIFVIDDEALDIMIFKLMVKRVDESLDVDAISSGHNAIDKLNQIAKTQPELMPDYIFLDLNMPGMNGWEFLDEYKRLNMDRIKKTHIYILSSSVYNNDLAKSQANSLVENFIYKPINLDNLREIFAAA
ncbi:hypothetical protein A0256_05810 [Mucilaginibacter sp. PAMC 26640]|nr:hypothetical protein A0256_05810 [Mucilaginibacter sp. PAMC 26640]